MTYLKDIKLCIDCQFYGNQHGEKDRCINPRFTKIDLVTGEEEYPYAYTQRKMDYDGYCTPKGLFFVLNADALRDRLQRLAEFEEVMKDAPF